MPTANLPAEFESTYGLSPMQSGMLFDSVFHPGAGYDVEQLVVNLNHEDLRTRDLERAWNIVTERHAVLRSVFRWSNDQDPEQAVQKLHLARFDVHDVSHLSSKDFQLAVEEFLAEDRKCGFDLRAVPAWRTTLFQSYDGNSCLIWSFHHILLDGRSILSVIREVFDVYRGLSGGQGIAEPTPDSLTFRDYIEWTHGLDLDRAREFWKSQFKDYQFTGPLSFGWEVHQKGCYGESVSRFSPELMEGLADLARREEVTFNTLLQGAWALCLARHQNQTTVTFGAPRACRRSPLDGRGESIVGLIMNILPVATTVDPSQSVGEFLRQLRVQWVEMRPYEHTPLYLIQNWCGGGIKDGLFDSVLAYETYEIGEQLASEGGEWEGRDVTLREQPSIPLTVAVYGSSQPKIKVVFDRSRFSKAGIELLVRQFETALVRMADHPNQKLGELSLLDPVQEHLVLNEWNQPRCDWPKVAGIHRLVELQARELSDGLSVCPDQADRGLSYNSLNGRANQLAGRLVSRGVTLESPVAVMMERSPDLIVTLLAILKSGGCYVPIDPDYPMDRIKFMLGDSAAVLLVTQERFIERLAAIEIPRLNLDSDIDWEREPSKENLHIEVLPENLAYIIYTSGSTGRPKGVQVSHETLANLVQWHREDYELSREDRTASIAGLGFDASVWEIWPTLASGASLFLPSEETRLSAERLIAWLTEMRISKCFVPTPLLEAMLARPWPAHSGLKVLLTGGDQLRSRPSRKIPFKLINHYGPTENTVVATAGAVEDDSLAAGLPSIGRPISNVQTYVLDGDYAFVSPGMTGEVYIGGGNLARAYQNQPGLTAERFIPNPFGSAPGERLYRTGDFARVMPDGCIEFLGRRDAQVKIRGFRIELEEIEHTLARHPKIAETAVAVHSEADANKVIVAYVVPMAVQAVTELELVQNLKSHLPTYMIPTAFVFLERLPLTPNGKIDRRSLPPPERCVEDPARPFVPARGLLEKTLERIWLKLLGVPRISVNDSFFDLGGHSLAATQLASEIKDRFQVNLSMNEFFGSPTIGALAELIETARNDAGIELSGRIVPRDRKSEIPLSFSQKRLWFIDQFEPGESVYNISVCLRFRGPLSNHVLEQSLASIVRRHESLRTSFKRTGEDPIQVVEDTGLTALDVVDFVVDGRESSVLSDECVREAERPFELATGPLIRAKLYRLAANDHTLQLTMHHIVSDGLSVSILISELCECYSAHGANRTPDLPDLPIQYGDFAAWQRGEAASEEIQQQLDYWTKTLAGELSALKLPTDRPHPPVQSYRGDRQGFAVDAGVYRSLQQLSQDEDATLFMVLLSAFFVLLKRHTHQSDLIVGSPLANRNRREVEHLVGFFANTLALRCDVSGALSFRDVLRRVRTVALEAYDHQDVPFERLVQELQPERNLSHNPIFQVMFVLNEAPSKTFEMDELQVEYSQVDSQTSAFDLTLSMEESAEGLSGVLEYNADLFDAVTMDRWIARYQRLLANLSGNLDLEIDRLDLLPSVERDLLIDHWSGSQGESSLPEPVVSSVESWFTDSPDAIAIRHQGTELSYAELKRRADQFANYLKAQEVGPETIVGVCLGRCTEMMVSMLGVLRSGAAFLPLDPKVPIERLKYMLADSRASILVTFRDGGLGEWFASSEGHDWADQHGLRLVFLGDSGFEYQESEQCSLRDSSELNIAYVIYTSGSTGVPKGVMISNLAMANHCQAVAAQYELSPSDRVLQFASLSFDVALEEIFPTWMSGATLVLRTEEMLGSVERFFSIIADERITVLNLPTAFWQNLVCEMESARCELPESIRLVVVGGERIAPESYLKWRRLVGDRVRWLNGYGPTEVAVTSTLGDPAVQVSALSVGTELTIGTAVANVRTYILDSTGQPVPVGVQGELCFGGRSLARGYLGLPDLTAATFGPNPFSEESGERLYRTGDIARYLADGNIEFIGRRDEQVKIRGFRIELGEIESALRQLPQVAAAAVRICNDSNGEKCLVGYVTSAGNESIESEGLDGDLRKRLPEYMIPTAWVVLDHLPLKAIGKIDRDRLPDPDWAASREGMAFVAPRNQTEELLATVWSRALNISEVGIHQNFFELGGHSLLATRLLSRVKRAFNVEVPLRVLFESPTVAGISGWLSRQQEDADRACAPPLQSRGSSGPAPLSFNQTRLWFLEEFDPGTFTNNIPYCVELEGTLNVEALQGSLNDLVRRHDVLRTSFAVEGGGPQQIVESVASFSIEVTTVDAADEVGRVEEARCLARSEFETPFDLIRGPLWRLRVLRLHETRNWLLVTLHHIIGDGWSMDLFLSELAAGYEAICSGAKPALPPPVVQYADVAVWQRNWLQGEILTRQLEYWRSNLEGAPGVLDLPTDRPRPRVQTFAGLSVTRRLSGPFRSQLEDLSKDSGCTLFMTLLAGFFGLLSRYSGTKDVVVGVPSAGRNDPQVEGLIGFFVNTLPTRCDLAGSPSFRDVLDRVRIAILEGQAHQDLPFEKLVEELAPERALSHHPIFQVMFVFEHETDRNLEFQGLQSCPLALEHRTAKFDLTLSVTSGSRGIDVVADYNQDLFEAATIERFLEHYENLLIAAVAEPDCPFDRFTIITPGEQQQLSEWGKSPDAERDARTVLDLFDEQVASQPGAVAVVCCDQSLTYLELDRQASRLAGELRSMGVEAATLVGVCVERSLQMPVALLATLRVGGAYVPLDPNFPEERIRQILEDARPAVLLTQESIRSDLPNCDAKVVCLDRDQESGGLGGIQEPTRSEFSHIDGDQLAYVIFTSGSTGRPKGVGVPHRALTNFLLSMAEAPGLGKNDRLLSVTTLSFDIAGLELFLPLIVGGRVVIASKDDTLDGVQLDGLIAKHEITVMQATPATWRLMLSAGWGGTPNLKMLCGGEAVPDDLARELLPRGSELWNMYGPTETTIWSAARRVFEAETATHVAGPVFNTQLYVLDENLLPVPIGVPGELFIGGEGVVRGYWGQSHLTAERFLPNLFSAIPGGRMYRTGDQVRWRSDGTLEFLGRLDFQVKVRGYRIELSEIEAVLNQHETVEESVVVARDKGMGNSQLVGYVVMRHSDGPASAELKDHVKGQLPDYMVPSQIVELQAMPLTPNGKVNRGALPETTENHGAGVFVAPRTETEIQLAALWKTSLDREQVSIHDNYFEFGGHSLLAARLAAEIGMHWQISLPIKMIFEHPTVAELANQIDAIRWAQEENTDSGATETMVEGEL